MTVDYEHYSWQEVYASMGCDTLCEEEEEEICDEEDCEEETAAWLISTMPNKCAYDPAIA